MFKAIIFDMDGVLIDAREWHYSALNQALEPFGMEIGLAEHEDKYNGLSTKTKLRMLSEEKGLPAWEKGLPRLRFFNSVRMEKRRS